MKCSAQLRGLAATVADQLNVGGQQLPQPVDVPVPEGVEEPPGEFLALAPAAASADDPDLRAAALTFVVVGGGFAGVEALAELQGLADEAVRFHPALNEAEPRWVLVEATGRILPELDERLGRWTLRALRRRGVDVRLHTRLASAAQGTVRRARSGPLPGPARRQETPPCAGSAGLGSPAEPRPSGGPIGHGERANSSCSYQSRSG